VQLSVSGIMEISLTASFMEISELDVDISFQRTICLEETDVWLF
jgi:hypothetical protein